MRTARLIALAAACTLAVVSSPAHAQLGKKLEEVQRESFWRSLNLQPVTPARAEGVPRVIGFRPANERFRESVLVTAGVDSEGVIQAMQVALSRSFLDDPRNAAQAREIAKNFLRAAVPGADADSVAILATEIEFPRDAANGRRRQPPQPLPAEPTAGYHVFLGHAPRFEQQLQDAVLSLRNEGEGDDARLVLRLRRS